MATRSQSCDVMSENLASVGKVKEDQATDDRIKWLGIPKCPHVCLKERHVCRPAASRRCSAISSNRAL